MSLCVYLSKFCVPFRSWSRVMSADGSAGNSGGTDGGAAKPEQDDRAGAALRLLGELTARADGATRTTTSDEDDAGRTTVMELGRADPRNEEAPASDASGPRETATRRDVKAPCSIENPRTRTSTCLCVSIPPIFCLLDAHYGWMFTKMGRKSPYASAAAGASGARVVALNLLMQVPGGHVSRTHRANHAVASIGDGRCTTAGPSKRCGCTSVNH